MEFGSNMDIAHLPNHGVELKEADGNVHGIKATFAFMEGLNTEVIEILDVGIRSAPQEESLWRMRLDMLRILDNRAEYERLALEFAKSFGVPAPDWTPIPQLDGSKQNVVTLKILTVNTETMTQMIESAHTALAAGGEVTFDFSRLTTSDKAGLVMLRDTLNKLIEEGERFNVVGAEKFILAIADHARKVGKAMPEVWAMAFLMMRIGDMQALHEALARDYCRTFEAAAPVWTPVDMPSAKEKASLMLEPINGAIPLAGSVTTIEAEEIQKMTALAQAGRLVIDLRACVRIALGPAELISTFLDRVNKPVIVTGANAMVRHALMYSAFHPMKNVIFKESTC